MDGHLAEGAPPRTLGAMDVWGFTVVGYLMSLLGAASGGPPCVALVGLDLQRSVGWSTGSVAAVQALYADPASAATDVAALQQWVDRGVRPASAMLVTGSCQVASGEGAVVRLEVVDRLAPTIAVDALGQATSLPVDSWSGRQVVLQQVDGAWRYAEVTTRP